MSATASEKKPALIVETVEGFLCTNEGCDNRRIPRHFTAMNIDHRTGEQHITAYCDSCRTLYKLTRKLHHATWAQGSIEVITDERRKQSFLRRVEHVQGISRATEH